MKKQAFILFFFFFSFLGLAAQDLPSNTVPVEEDSPEVIYNGPSDQFLLIGLGMGIILDFTYDSDDQPVDYFFSGYIDPFVNYRIQIDDILAFDATLDYHFSLAQDEYTGLGLSPEKKIMITPLLITHIYHGTRTRKFMQTGPFIYPVNYLILPPMGPGVQSIYNVETLDTFSLRAGTNLFLGLDGFGVDPSQSLVVGLEFRSLTQGSFISASGKNIVIQDFFTINIDGIVNYPKDKSFSIMECLGVNIGASYTLGGLVGSINLGVSSFTPGTPGLIDHVIRYSTTLMIPFRL